MTAARRIIAFSLVEVVLALGIVSFALVAIFGLMTVGLDSSRDSLDDTAVGLIAQDVAARVRAEVNTRSSAVTSSALNLVWNQIIDPSHPGNICYDLIANAPLPTSPQPRAAAYYSREGLFINQRTGDTKKNYYCALIYASPLAVYPPNATPQNYPVGAIYAVDYPFIAVKVDIGWPAQAGAHTSPPSRPQDAVIGGLPNSAKFTATLYLPKP